MGERLLAVVSEWMINENIIEFVAAHKTRIGSSL